MKTSQSSSFPSTAQKYLPPPQHLCFYPHRTETMLCPSWAVS